MGIPPREPAIEAAFRRLASRSPLPAQPRGSGAGHIRAGAGV